MDQEQLDVHRSDARDARRLADRPGPDALQLLPRLVAEMLHLGVVELVGDDLALEAAELRDRLRELKQVLFGVVEND